MRLSSGYLIGLPIAFIALVLLVLLAVCSWRRVDTFYERSTYGGSKSWTGWAIMAVWSTVVCVLYLVAMPWAFFPWSIQYHEWVNKSGTVSVIGDRFQTGETPGDTSGAANDFVVQFAGSSVRYDCMDTRCALVHAGDRLDMSCIRLWQWTGVPGWSCNYTKDQP